MLGVIILPFIAILFDLVAAAAYFLQYNHQSSEVVFVGMIFQGVITLLLLIMIISYKGKNMHVSRQKYLLNMFLFVTGSSFFPF